MATSQNKLRNGSYVSSHGGHCGKICAGWELGVGATKCLDCMVKGPGAEMPRPEHGKRASVTSQITYFTV